MEKPQTNNTQNQENPNPDPTGTQENTEQVTDIPPVTNVGKVYTEEQVQAIHQLYGGALQEKEGELISLRQQGQRTQDIQQHNPEADAQQLMTDPRTLIRDEIKQAIAPLAEGLNQFRAMSVYDNLKSQFRVHPNYSRHFEIPGFEGYLDQIMQGVQQVTIPVVQEAITRVVGFMVTNNLYNPVNTQQIQQIPINNNQPNNQNNNPPRQQNNQPNGNMNLPAHLRPSGAPAPGGGNNNLTPNGNPRRPLSENEKRVARERRLSDDDYLDWLATPSTGVVQSKIGIKKP